MSHHPVPLVVPLNLEVDTLRVRNVLEYGLFTGSLGGAVGPGFVPGSSVDGLVIVTGVGMRLASECSSGLYVPILQDGGGELEHGLCVEAEILDNLDRDIPRVEPQ